MVQTIVNLSDKQSKILETYMWDNKIKSKARAIPLMIGDYNIFSHPKYKGNPKLNEAIKKGKELE